MNRTLALLCTALLAILSMSCHRDHPSESKTKRTVLVYVVVSDLPTFLSSDKEEMILAAPDVAGLGKDVRVMLYSYPNSSAEEATLSELSKDSNGGWDFKTLKTYDRNTFSTDPSRMSEVFADVHDVSPSDKYGLIFWSHGSGWIPMFSEHEVPNPEGMQKSFGIDNYHGRKDYCDIDELADAIPDRMFDYIWFDVCYMMGVEVVYQLRDKCDYIVGCPAEDPGNGMNYNSTLPMLAKLDPDLEGAARSFYDYYMNQNSAVTVTVMSTEGLDRLAAATAEIYAYGSRPGTPFGIQKYGRGSYSSYFYDFGHYTKKYLDPADTYSSLLADTFDSVMNDIIVYKACSAHGFDGSSLDQELYSGLSCHFLGSSDWKKEEYYRSLDWTKAVNP